jgi:hypothetical protein
MTLHVMPLAAFALLAALQFTRFGLAERAVAGPATDAEPAVQRALACSAGSLPPQVGLLQRAKFVPQTRDRDDILGNFSRTYEYRDANGTHYVASCDFPYSGGWHELTVCYRGLGWELQERRIGVQESDPHAESWPCLEADFSKPDGMKGFLVASAFDYTGQPVELPSYSFFDDLSRALTNSRGARGNRSVFQVQVWTTAARPIDGRDREAARQLLTVARQRFHELITASAGPGRDAPAPSEQ